MPGPRNVKSAQVRKAKPSRASKSAVRPRSSAPQDPGVPPLVRPRRTPTPNVIVDRRQYPHEPGPIERVPLQSLTLNPRNSRTHSKKQIRQIANSVQRYGWTYPLLIDENGVILAGNGRYQAAQLLGLRTVPVIRLSGLTETEKRALVLADNKIAANAGWNRAILASELQDLAQLLPEVDLTLDITGFEMPEIDSLLQSMSDPEGDPEEVLPQVEDVPVSAPGDLWILDRQRLICGDSKDGRVYGRLMGTARAAMVFTDPPYNLKVSGFAGRGRTKHREFHEASGEMTGVAFVDFLATYMGHVVAYSTDGSIHFHFMDHRHLREILEAGERVYGAPKTLIVWVKPAGGMGTFYRSQHELVFVFKNGDAPHVNNFELGQHGRTRTNVWTYPVANTFKSGPNDKAALHPTIKPVKLVADALRDCSKRGDIVLDPFCGSGTTILAAEQVGRRAYCVEIDPKYVDLAVRRWQTFTGHDAILCATGQTFSEVAESRQPANAVARRLRP